MNKFNISALLTKVKPNEKEEQLIIHEINLLKDNEILQTEFFEYCNKNKLATWIYLQLKSKNLFDFFSNKVKSDFIEVYDKVKNQNDARNKEATIFLSEFKKQGIEVAILKGNLFIHTVFNDSGYKRMNDFDILIKKEDWQKAQEIYFKLGYTPLGFGWGGEKQKPAKYSHVGMSFISKNFTCIIGTQWGLKSPTAKFKVDIDKAWKTATDFDFNGITVKKLSPEYNLLHLILHIGIYKIGTRDCMDIYNLWDTENIDTEKLYLILEKSKAIEKAYFTFVLCNICSNSFSPEFIHKLVPVKIGFISKRLIKRLDILAKTGDLHTSYNDYFQDIEKNVIYMGIFQLFHQKLHFYLKILGQIYFPKSEIMLKLLDKTEFSGFWDKFISRFKTPKLVFALIAQEIGPMFTFLLFIKLFVDTTISLKNYIFKQESYFEYLKKRGINPKDIEQVVKNVQ